MDTETEGGRRTYRLKTSLRWFLGFMAVFFLVVIIGITIEIVTEQQPLSATAFFVVWLVFVVAAVGWSLARIPHEIQISGELIRFRTVMRRFEVPIHTVESVKARWNDPFGNLPVLTHRSGKIPIISAMDGFHEFLDLLKQLNPAIEIRGL